MKNENLNAELQGMPPLPKKRGRPASGNAKTGAERMKALRDKREIKIIAAVGTCANLSDDELRAEMGQTNDAEVFEIYWLTIGRRMGWV